MKIEMAKKCCDQSEYIVNSQSQLKNCFNRDLITWAATTLSENWVVRRESERDWQKNEVKWAISSLKLKYYINNEKFMSSPFQTSPSPS